jgi:uncharacterized membrane protein HdeD (DUF308 family)
MATGIPFGPSRDLSAETRVARPNWGRVLALGIVQIVVGTLAVLMAFTATFATVIAIGVLALFGAGGQLASVFASRHWQGVLLHLLVAVLYAAFGLITIARPELAATTLTLLLAVMLIVGGLFRVFVAAGARFHDWGWAAIGGAISVLLGVLIWQGWPGTGLWVLGLFVGIDLIFIGWTWVAVGLTLRRLSPPTAPGA